MNKKASSGLKIKKLMHAGITSTGVAFPKNGRWVSNEEIHHLIHGSNWRETMASRGWDINYVQTVLGYENRFWTHTPGEPFDHAELTSADLMEYASLQALERANLSPGNIDLFIAVTVTSPKYTNSMGPFVGGKLGIKAPSIEIKTGCASCLFGMVMAYQFIQSGARHVLITAGETPTKVTNRKTNLVYSVGDGGAAVIISKIDDRNRGLEIGWLNSEGSFSGILGSGGSLPPNKMDVDADAYYMEIGSNADDFISNAWKQIPTVLLEDKNYKAEDVAALIPHQVNKKVMANICEASDIPAERTVDLISQYGNCGSASVLIALDHAVTTGMVKENDLAMLAVVGGGISWGGLLVRV